MMATVLDVNSMITLQNRLGRWNNILTENELHYPVRLFLVVIAFRTEYYKSS
jgi:hypothetical protein